MHWPWECAVLFDDARMALLLPGRNRSLALLRWARAQGAHTAHAASDRPRVLHGRQVPDGYRAAVLLTPLAARMRSLLRRLLDASYDSERNHWRRTCAALYALDLESAEGLVASLREGGSEVVISPAFGLAQPQAHYVEAVRCCGGRVVASMGELRAALCACQAVGEDAPLPDVYHASAAEARAKVATVTDDVIHELVHLLWPEDVALFGGEMGAVPAALCMRHEP